MRTEQIEAGFTYRARNARIVKKHLNDRLVVKVENGEVTYCSAYPVVKTIENCKTITVKAFARWASQYVSRAALYLENERGKER